MERLEIKFAAEPLNQMKLQIKTKKHLIKLKKKANQKMLVFLFIQYFKDLI